MKNIIRNFGASVLSVSMIALSAITAVPQADAAVSSWQKGVSIESRYSTDFASSAFQQSVQNAKAAGANYVTLVLPYYQSNQYSTDIAPGANTPTDAALTAGINYVHSQGMKVMLKPHLEAYTGAWRAYINPSDRQTWFTNYGNVILYHLADIAKQTGAEQICIGAELISMSTYTVNGNNTQQWQTLISGVRSRYSGALTYSANWGAGDFANEKAHIGFWPQLDYIGISAYFNLYGGWDNQTLKNAWDGYNRNEIKPLSDANGGKPVIFTEIGYRSVSGAHEAPWDYNRGGGYDPDEQSRDFNALFDYWNGQPFMAGIHIWNWYSDPNAGGAGNTDYTPQNKPAINILKQWFGNSTPDTPPTTGGGTGTTTTGGGTGGTGNTTVSGNFSATGSVTPASPVVNQALTQNGTVTIGGTASNVIVDMEIYNSANQKVNQKFFEGQTFASNETKQYTAAWTPTQTGTYKTIVGVFNKDWTQSYLWKETGSFTVNQPSTTGGGTGTTTTGGNTGGSNSSFSMTAATSPATSGVNVSATASAKGNTLDTIVDYEIYNSSGTRVLQQVFTGQDLTGQTAKGYQFGFTPTAAGTYTIKGGIFNNNWSTNYYWHDNLATFTTTGSTGGTGGTGGTGTTTTGGGTGGTGTTTTGGGGTTTPPPTSYNTNIWWPSNGATVSGVLPFKAMVEGLDVSQYQMYWQVDGGALVQMANSTTDYPHKESLVDVSGWNWKGNGPYTLNFVSKNSSGSTISSKSTNINISH